MRLLAIILAILFTCTVTHAESEMSVTSPEITPDGAIAAEQVFNSSGCSGGNVSPALRWEGAPVGTKSFAVSIYDPDAPTGSGFWHWVAYNIPPSVTSLPKGAGVLHSAAMPAGSTQIRNDYGQMGYGGPCPPKGDAHHYVITVFAVDTDKLDGDESTTPAVIGFQLHFHTIAKATLLGLYGLPGK